MHFSLKTLATLAVASAPFFSNVVNAAVVYVTPCCRRVCQWRVSSRILCYCHCSCCISSRPENCPRNRNHLHSKTVRVTAPQTTVVTTITYVEPNKVEPAKTKLQDNIFLSSIHASSYSLPKAVYPIVTSLSEAAGTPSTSPSSTLVSSPSDTSVYTTPVFALANPTATSQDSSTASFIPQVTSSAVVSSEISSSVVSSIAPSSSVIATSVAFSPLSPVLLNQLVLLPLQCLTAPQLPAL